MNGQPHDFDKSESPYLFPRESYDIQGAIFEVYKEKGNGFLEPVYQECLTKEFILRGTPFQAQPSLQIFYKGEPLTQIYKPDFICYGKIIVELKTARELIPEHEAQILNYLKATNHRLGFLVNFASYPKVTIKRFVR